MQRFEICVPKKDKYNSWYRLTGQIIEAVQHPEKKDFYLVPQTDFNEGIRKFLYVNWGTRDYHYKKGRLSISKHFVRPINNRQAILSALRSD